jgi:hypothetical protein
LPAKLPDLIASLHPKICWSSGISDLPVQLRSFKVCARTGASIHPGDRTANDSIAAAAPISPMNSRRRMPAPKDQDPAV